MKQRHLRILTALSDFDVLCNENCLLDSYLFNQQPGAFREQQLCRFLWMYMVPSWCSLLLGFFLFVCEFLVFSLQLCLVQSDLVPMAHIWAWLTNQKSSSVSGRCL